MYELNISNLDNYIKTVKQIPYLTREEEFALADKHQKYNDLNAAKKLIESHLRYVVSIASKFDGYGIPKEDLIQEGNIGLMKAVKAYKANMSARLTSYAIHWIKSEILEYIVKNWRIVKIATTKAQRKLFFNLRSIKSTFNSLSQSEVKLIADKLNVKESDIMTMESRFSNLEMSLENDSDDDVLSPLDWIKDNQDYEPHNIYENSTKSSDNSLNLDVALNKLDDRQKYVIQCRYLDDNNKKTLQDLSKELNVSTERVRQLEVASLKLLKNMLETSYLCYN